MPISIRVDEQLEAKLRAIADSEGISLSEVVRRAALKYVDQSGDSLGVRLADVLGAVKSTGRRAHRTGEAFKRVLRKHQ